MLGISVRGMIASSDIYQLKLIKLVDQLSVQALSYGYNIDVSLIKQSLIELPFLNWFKTFSGSLVGIIGNLILISIFVMFFMMGKNTSPSPKNGALMDTAVRRQITRYLTTKIFVSSLTAIIVGTVLSIFHVQLALMFATLTFFLNFIPNIGSLIATILPLPIMIVQFGFSGILIPIMILIASTQFTIGNIIEPRMMGKSLGLHPVVILLSLLFWGFIWGVPGMFLAVPMTAVLKLILERYPVTYSIAHLLEGDLSMASMIFSTSDDRQQLK